MKKNFQKKLRPWIVGILSSAIFGYLSFRNFQWSVLRDIVLGIDLAPFLMAGIFMLVAFGLRAYRWKFFLPESESFSFSSRLYSVIIGYFFSNILPGNLGDLVRPAYLAKMNKQPYQICLYSVIKERIWDLVAFLLLAVILLRFASISSLEILPIRLPLLIGLILVGVFLTIFLENILQRLISILKYFKMAKIASRLKEIEIAFDKRSNSGFVFRKVIITVFIYFTEGLFFVYISKSLHAFVDFISNYVIMVVTGLSYLLPSAPASIGVFHYFCQISYTMLGFSSDISLSAAIVVHAYFVGLDFICGSVIILFGPVKMLNLIRYEVVESST